MTVRVTHTIDTLAADLRAKPREAAVGMAKTLRQNAEEGNRRAKAYAKESAGKHGVHYPTVFTAEARTPMSWEYGPDANKVVSPRGKRAAARKARRGAPDKPFRPGGMATGFEQGSRNQPPHRDLERSAAGIGFKLQHDVGDLLDRLFW